MTKQELFEYYDVTFLDLMIELTSKERPLKINEFYGQIGHAEQILDSCFQLTDWDIKDFMTVELMFYKFMDRQEIDFCRIH